MYITALLKIVKKVEVVQKSTDRWRNSPFSGTLGVKQNEELIYENLDNVMPGEWSQA